MADSQFRLVGRGLGALVAASLLTGVSLDAAAAGNKGIIRLQLGKAGVADGFYFYEPDGVTPTGDFQKFSVTQKCIVDTNGWSLDTLLDGPGQLVDLQAIGPSDSTNPRPGLLSGSLGVYDNSKGVSCTRMTASIGEGLIIETLVGGFDRLSLDMELKGNAVFELQIVGGNTYTLRSGTSRIPNGYEGEADPDHPVVNCAGSSDSGPDSGPSDNCRWVINDVGSAFYLTAEAGEGSLEGGGDFAGLVGDFDTKIYLTSLIDVGSLGCEASNNKTAKVFDDPLSQNAASCQVTRIKPAGTTCDVIDYRLETFKFDSLCSLDKTGIADTNKNGQLDEQLAGSLQVTFAPEGKPGDWEALPQTIIQFEDSNEDFYLNRCGGTVVQDANGNSTIAEVLTTGLKGVMLGGQFVARPPDTDIGETEVTLSTSNDAYRSNSTIDWACVLETRDVYEGGEIIQVTQTILFWGDIRFERL